MNQTYLVQLSQSDLETLIATTIRNELSQLLPSQEQTEPDNGNLLKVPDIQQMFGTRAILGEAVNGSATALPEGDRDPCKGEEDEPSSDSGKHWHESNQCSLEVVLYLVPK